MLALTYLWITISTVYPTTFEQNVCSTKIGYANVVSLGTNSHKKRNMATLTSAWPRAWTRTWPSIGIRMKKWKWFRFVWMVHVVLQGAWVLHGINKDEGDESLSLAAFRRKVVNPIFLKYSKKDILSLNHVGIRNTPSHACYYDTKLYQMQS